MPHRERERQMFCRHRFGSENYSVTVIAPIRLRIPSQETVEECFPGARRLTLEPARAGAVASLAIHLITLRGGSSDLLGQVIPFKSSIDPACRES